MKKKIQVNFKDYNRHIEKYGNSNLCDNFQIYSKGCLPKFMNVNEEEIFEGKETKYEIIKNLDNLILIKFKSKSLTDYRLDLMKEPNTDIWHIGFSLFDIQYGPDYDKRTEKYEAIDTISRIIWILNDMDMNCEYCIGATSDSSKNIIYEYILKSSNWWEKRLTNQYDLGWGIYFRI
jgi:hypothetical protein